MVFETRGARLFITVLFGLTSVFTYDSLMRHLWANAVVGGLIATGLLLVAAGGYSYQRKVAVIREDRHEADPEHLRALLDQMPIPLVSYAGDLPPQALNRSARALFQTDDAIPLSFEELSAALSAPMHKVRPIVSIGGRRYALSLSEVQNDQQFVRLAALMDVEAEIHKAEAGALRDTLQILSHEIMNSLTPVSSLAEIAGMYLTDETDIDGAREAVDTLARRTANLTCFIEAYRSVARLPEPVLQPVDPGQLVRDILSIFTRSHDAGDVLFDLQVDDVSGRLFADESQLEQAIINVLTNALEATEALGSQRHITVTVARTARFWRIAIADNGPGISPDIINQLFNGFSSTKPKGTGTGLNLARQIALAHGGNLELVDGRAGQTTFAFTFPNLT
ncbi:MAG: ATP-binding protein [Asticcacaulis sp.]